MIARLRARRSRHGVPRVAAGGARAKRHVRATEIRVVPQRSRPTSSRRTREKNLHDRLAADVERRLKREPRRNRPLAQADDLYPSGEGYPWELHRRDAS
jgi:hypothetical protein